MEDDDSRTTSLGRKRDRESGLKLDNYTKRRRADLQDGTEKQTPTGGSSRTDTLPSSGTESESDVKRDANGAYDAWEAKERKGRANSPPVARTLDAEIGYKEVYVEREPGASPSVNWNAGSKAKIRISLGRRTQQANVGKSQSHITTKIADVATRDEDPDTVSDDKFNDPFSQSSQAMYSSRPERSKDANQILESSFAKLEHVTASSAMARGTDDVGVGIHTEPSTDIANLVQDNKDDEEIVINIQKTDQDNFKASGFESSDRDKERKSAPALEKSSFAGTDPSESETGYATETECSQVKETTENSNLKQPSSQDSYSLEGKPKILADLNPEELKLQVRYFFLGKNVEDVDRSRPVRCIICTREGHISEFCDSLICNVCGNRSEHNSKKCPRVLRCSRCREPGHGSSSCQRKVLPREVTCGWCELKGHVEEECELFWRTSGRPWESEFTIKSFGLSCYECGGLGHLGNDCPTRRPGKKMGTSTWTLPERSSVDPKGGILIKGRAEQRNSFPQIEKDDERANFLHPKAVRPPRRAQIQIAPQGFRNAPTRQDNDSIGSRVEQYWPDPRNFRGDQSQPSYQSYGRHTGSPTYYSRDSGSASDRYVPRSGGEPFRPMPSSAQKAWVKYRT